MRLIDTNQIKAFTMPLLFLIVACVAAIRALDFPQAGSGAPGPAIAPLLFAGLLGLLAIVLLGQTVKGLFDVSIPKETNARKMRQFILILIAYATAMPHLGFVSASILLILVSLRLFGYQSWLQGAAIACIVVWILYGIFALLMHVPLPQGILG